MNGVLVDPKDILIDCLTKLKKKKKKHNSLKNLLKVKFINLLAKLSNPLRLLWLLQTRFVKKGHRGEKIQRHYV